MPTAQRTPAGEALRAMLPAGTDPYKTIALACQTAFMARDRDILPGITDVAKADPDLAASLIVALAAFVDVDNRPSDMLSWLGTHDGRDQETVRQAAALTEARSEYDEATGDTLPPVTLESMREMAHAARLAGVVHPCGTLAASRRHDRKGQKQCPRCRWAQWLYARATPEERALLRSPIVDVVAGTTNRNWGRVRCGTISGYDAHRAHGERICDKCLEAAAAVVAAVEKATRPKPTTKRRQCGSHEGYVAHRRVRETPCDDCREAQTVYDAERYLERKAKRPVSPPRRRGRPPRASSSGTVQEPAATVEQQSAVEPAVLPEVWSIGPEVWSIEQEPAA